jgi:Uncharacterised nucleotidyltransferase
VQRHRLDDDRLDRLLWSCLHAYPEPPKPAFLPDDPALLGFWERAADHGVAVLVARQLGLKGSAAPMRDAALWQTALALGSRTILNDVLDLFQRNGIRWAPLKGPLLAVRLYGEYTLRPTGDVDVLVGESDLDDALQVLERAGARMPTRASYRYHRAHHHHVNVVFRETLIEIHFRATSNFGAVIPAEPLLARSTIARVDGALVSVLDPTDEIVVLAVNAAAHAFRGVLLLDLRRLAERAPVDWTLAWDRAQAWRVTKATAAALVAAGSRVGLDLHHVPAAWRARGKHALRLLHALPLHEEPGSVRQARNLALQAVLTDSSLRAGGMLFHHALHVLRRRVQRRWPSLSPPDWAG